MKHLLILAFIATTFFACKKKEPKDYLVADGGKWNLSDVYTVKQNGVLQSSSTYTGTMTFSSSGSVSITLNGGGVGVLNWVATTENLTLTDPTTGVVYVNKYIESTSKLQRFFIETTQTTGGNTTITKEDYTLTK
jgi:hypothetical protein